MKIAQLTPGSGKNFYCENCQRDITLVKGLRRQGYDILMMPLYLPLQAEAGQDPTNTPVFFGGINVYLQQKMAIFRKSPRWLDKLFDRRGLLEIVSKRATMVDAASLGETTISMLMGEHGRQVKELRRLVEWLSEDENRPDVVCLSNILLAGMAGEIKARLGVPVVCMLQDEDEFVDALPDDYRKRTWDILRQRCEDIDMFVPVSEYYKTFMRERLGAGEEKFSVVRMGIDISAYVPRQQAPESPSIGYLSRMCPGKGLDVLVDAFIELKGKVGLEDVKLKIAGGLAGEDVKFVDGLKAKLAKAGVDSDVQFRGFVEGGEKLDFLRGVSCVCVPEVRPPAYGLYVLEAFALGVPVVEPEAGVFPELIAGEERAGVLYSPNTAGKLAGALERVLTDREQLDRMGTSARKIAEQRFDVSLSVETLKGVYDRLAGGEV